MLAISKKDELECGATNTCPSSEQGKLDSANAGLLRDKANDIIALIPITQPDAEEEAEEDCTGQSRRACNSEDGRRASASLEIGGFDVATAAEELPEEYALHQNHPNPFNPTTVISFALPEASYVRLTVFDMLGREVRTLVQSTIDAGAHQVQFEATGLPSGTYLYRLTTPTGSFVKTMLLLK